MIDRTRGILIDDMHLRRIKEHPIQINNSSIIANDNLEAGSLRLYENTEGAVTIQELFNGYKTSNNSVLVTEIVINTLWQPNGIFIHKIFCEHGYEELINPIINQVLHFAYFYEFLNAVGISEREYKQWYPYAKEALTDFQKIQNVYKYSVPDFITAE